MTGGQGGEGAGRALRVGCWPGFLVAAGLPPQQAPVGPDGEAASHAEDAEQGACGAVEAGDACCAELADEGVQGFGGLLARGKAGLGAVRQGGGLVTVSPGRRGLGPGWVRAGWRAG